MCRVCGANQERRAQRVQADLCRARGRVAAFVPNVEGVFAAEDAGVPGGEEDGRAGLAKRAQAGKTEGLIYYLYQ